MIPTNNSLVYLINKYGKRMLPFLLERGYGFAGGYTNLIRADTVVISMVMCCGTGTCLTLVWKMCVPCGVKV